jgi:hypothetical protein
MPQGKDEYRSSGQQVLLNDRHYADARDPDAALAIAYALNSVYLAKLGPEPGKQCPTCKCVGGAHAVNCVERGTNGH